MGKKDRKSVKKAVAHLKDNISTNNNEVSNNIEKENNIEKVSNNIEQLPNIEDEEFYNSQDESFESLFFSESIINKENPESINKQLNEITKISSAKSINEKVNKKIKEIKSSSRIDPNIKEKLSKYITKTEEYRYPSEDSLFSKKKNRFKVHTYFYEDYGFFSNNIPLWIVILLFIINIFIYFISSQKKIIFISSKDKVIGIKVKNDSIKPIINCIGLCIDKKIKLFIRDDLSFKTLFNYNNKEIKIRIDDKILEGILKIKDIKRVEILLKKDKKKNSFSNSFKEISLIFPSKKCIYIPINCIKFFSYFNIKIFKLVKKDKKTSLYKILPLNIKVNFLTKDYVEITNNDINIGDIILYEPNLLDNLYKGKEVYVKSILEDY